MQNKRTTILLVMHKVPVDSVFLAMKFIRLNEKINTHMLVWDTQKSINDFKLQNNLTALYTKKIHLGYHKASSKVLALYHFVEYFIKRKRVRKYIIYGDKTLAERIKFVIKYLPAIALSPEVIHFEFGTLAREAIDLKSILNTKLSVSFRGYDLNYAGLSENDFYRDVWGKFDGVHFLGRDLKQRAIDRGYAGKQLEALIPAAIDINFFKREAIDKSFEKLTIISVGRLVWKKGYEYGIRAAALLKNRGIPFQYYIIGTGDYLQAIQFTINELGLKHDVELCGEMTPYEIRNQLCKAHVFLHPAISEGFSNAVLEAQAMGLPVICTDADGLSENIEDGVTGFIVPKWDSIAIADKLCWCWEHRQQLHEIGQAGISRVNKHFKIEDQINALEAFYRKLIDKGEN